MAMDAEYDLDVGGGNCESFETSLEKGWSMTGFSARGSLWSTVVSNETDEPWSDIGGGYAS